MTLKRQQMRLANRILETGNLRQSAIEEGYSPNYIGQLFIQASDPSTPLGGYLSERRQEMMQSVAITRERKRKKLWDIAERCFEEKPALAIKALHELNLMDGDHAPVYSRVRIENKEPKEVVVFDQRI